MKKLLLFAAIMSLLVLAGCGSKTDSGDLSLEDSGMIAPLGNLSFDWKDIDIGGGTAEHSFKFKNDGKEDLVIKSATTSCMCTTATVKLADGSQSQAFGMHGGSKWGGVVKPGEEFEVYVVFDPMAHGPDAVGPIERSIYLETSSKANGNYAKMDKKMKSMVTEMTLSGDVLYSKDYEAKNSKSVFFYPKQSMTSV